MPPTPRTGPDSSPPPETPAEWNDRKFADRVELLRSLLIGRVGPDGQDPRYLLEAISATAEIWRMKLAQCEGRVRELEEQLVAADARKDPAGFGTDWALLDADLEAICAVMDFDEPSEVDRAAMAAFDRLSRALTGRRGPFTTRSTPLERAPYMSGSRTAAEIVAVVHGQPATANGPTPCCGLDPFGLPTGDRIAVGPEAANCQGRPMTLNVSTSIDPHVLPALAMLEEATRAVAELAKFEYPRSAPVIVLATGDAQENGDAVARANPKGAGVIVINVRSRRQAVSTAATAEIMRRWFEDDLSNP